MTSPTQLYIPPASMLPSAYPASPTRMLLVGGAGRGKTFSAMTFPNPIICDLDNKLNGYKQFKPTHEFHAIPFWNTKFVTEVCKCNNAGPGKPFNPKYPANTRDAFKYWLIEEGPKLTKEQTLIVDSWTSMHTAFDLQSKLPHEVVWSTKTGQEDGFAFWGRKKQYSKEIVDALKALSCNVVVIAHETFERDENGRIIGLKALQDGSYADELPTQFTDVYRQHVFTKEEAAKRGLKQDENIAYWWQTDKDQYFTFACKSKPSLPAFVTADYSSLTNN